MEKLCDLHVHSYYSDGSQSPAELLAEAEAAGLSAIALTDHNTVAGLPEFTAAGQGSPVEAVPGIEFSTEFEGVELHIIGLYIPEHAYGEITERMQALLQRKQAQNRALVDALRAQGMDLDYDAICRMVHNHNLNRAHIAMAMVEGGYVTTRQEAFRTWLSPERGFYVPPKRLDAFETVRYIKQIGAAAVLAHPYMSFKSQEQLERFLGRAGGLDGMEVIYSENDEATTRCSRETADRFGLLYSGGSDYHGANKPYLRMGSGKGSLRIPLELLEKLRERAGKT